MLLLQDSPETHWPSFIAKCRDGELHNCPSKFPEPQRLDHLKVGDEVFVLSKGGSFASIEQGRVVRVSERIDVEVGAQTVSFRSDGNHIRSELFRIVA